jgi:hypothetical protein
VKTLLLTADDLLHGERARRAAVAQQPRTLLLVLMAFGSTYGAVMGTFGGFEGERLLQIIYSAVKVPMLLLVTFAISVPSFFIFNTLLGLREDFREALAALVATQAGLTVILASLAPMTALWYASSSNYDQALLFNGLMFGVASIAAQWILRARYRPLIARNPRHRLMLRGWLVLYAFIAIQLAWVLRPFVGAPTAPVRFFREDAWGNAYIVILERFARVAGF